MNRLKGLTQCWCRTTLSEQLLDDRRSVIKGLSTRVDQNVTKLVKDMVQTWNDMELSGSLIITVQRNTKLTYSESECPSNLFVTAVSPRSIRSAEELRKRCLSFCRCPQRHRRSGRQIRRHLSHG